MDLEFLAGLTPRILAVLRRDSRYWRRCDYCIARPRTRLNVMAYVQRGRGVFVLDAQAQDLHDGCVFHFPAGSRNMNIFSARNDPVEFIAVHFDYAMLSWKGGQGVVRREEPRALPFANVVHGCQASPVEDIFGDALQVWQRRQAGYEWFAKVGFLRALGEIVSMVGERAQWENPSARVIRTAIEYMKKNLGGPLDRETLARRLSLSPGYFSTLFHQQTGTSPSKYVTGLRIDRAKDLLSSTDLPVMGIAKDVGFTDPFYFARVFKKETGISPSEYRRS